VPAVATLDGKKFGYGYQPSVDIPPTTEDTTCDQIAAFGKDKDGKETVREVSFPVPQGFQVPIIGAKGETITFKYYRASEDRVYYAEFEYIMQTNGQIGSFGTEGPKTLVLLRDPPCIECATCTQYQIEGNKRSFADGRKCKEKAGKCEYEIVEDFLYGECINNDLVSCFEPCGAPVSPPPSPSPPPPVPDVAPVQKKITLVKGWQVSSFQYLCEGDFTVITKSSVGWKVNDKMMARMGSLKIATYDGTKWQGELVRTGLFFKYGYKIFSKVAGVVITQTCENQNPVKDIPLTKGWNWMGSPYIGCFPINELKTVGDGQFTVDDEIKSRALQVRISRYDGEEWTTSSIPCFQNGMGYEVKVNVSVTVSFNE